MLVQEAQDEVRRVYVGGFFGQMVSSVIWLTSTALGARTSPRNAIEMLVVGGFFIFPLTQLCLRFTGRRASLDPKNPLNGLAMQLAFSLPLTMLLLVPVTAFRLNWFYPGMLILLAAHYLPFVFLYGMRMFYALSGVLAGCGVVTALYFSKSFSIGGWAGGITLLIFSVIGGLTPRIETTQTPAA